MILGAALQADGEYEVRGHGLKHEKEKRSMEHFAGLDVSVKDPSSHSIFSSKIKCCSDRLRPPTNNGQISILAGNSYDAIDPSATFDTGDASEINSK
jgi:hypothetical protein